MNYIGLKRQYGAHGSKNVGNRALQENLKREIERGTLLFLNNSGGGDPRL
jgi:hypothetical protein